SLTITATATQTETATPTLTETPSLTITATATQTETATATATTTQTETAIQTETATPTQTQTETTTPTQTQTKTATLTMTTTPTLKQTIISTPTLSQMKTATPTITWSGMQPTLKYGSINPARGNQDTTFEYNVFFCDFDGGNASLTRIYINNNYRIMNLKSGNSSEGWYNVRVSGYELNGGNNEFYFLFTDDKNKWVRLPSKGSYKGPFVDYISSPTNTPTETPTVTQTHTITSTLTTTVTPTPTPTLTDTPIPDDCLVITSPVDFYFNTIILSWTPIKNLSYYILEFNLYDNLYSVRFTENWARITLRYQDEWLQFTNLQRVTYRVTAYDNKNRIIDGPTAWSRLICQSDCNSETMCLFSESVDPGYLRITNPNVFYFNTILLSWTPVKGITRYLIEYKYEGIIYRNYLHNNWIRLIVSDNDLWNQFKNIGSIQFRVSALDPEGYKIDGPTDWMTFRCN
ncbi:hypothetical protein KKB18_08400, partial [bacterium]|nr:hypothetical protein [bacterium]